jgi:hypothetical protein
MAKIEPQEPCPCGSGKTFAECHRPTVKSGPLPITTHELLTVISQPDPDMRSVFEKTGESTVFFVGEFSGLSLDCGGCEAPLVLGLNRDQIRGVVLRCRSCGAYNDT